MLSEEASKELAVFLAQIIVGGMRFELEFNLIESAEPSIKRSQRFLLSFFLENE